MTFPQRPTAYYVFRTAEPSHTVLDVRPEIRIVHWRVIGSVVILRVKIDGWKMAAPH